MYSKQIWHEIKCFGSATVGSRGQVVIPASARKELGIDSGDTMLFFTGPGRMSLVLLKVDAIEHMLAIMGKQLADFEKMWKDFTPAKAAMKQEAANAQKKI